MVDTIATGFKINTSADIRQKINYFREISHTGISNLSESQYKKLCIEVPMFYNMFGIMHGDFYYDKLFRVVVNNRLPHIGRNCITLVTDLLGPPADVAPLGRCNLPREEVAYFSTLPATSYLEAKLKRGDLMTLTSWQLKPGHILNINYVYNSKQIVSVNEDFKQPLQEFERWKETMRTKDQNNLEVSLILENFITDEFIKDVPAGKPKEYLFTAVLSSTWLMDSPDPEMQLDGIAYPSVIKKLHGTNVTLRRSSVLKHYELKHLLVKDVGFLVEDELEPWSKEWGLGLLRTYKDVKDVASSTDRFTLGGDNITYLDPVEIHSPVFWNWWEGNVKTPSLAQLTAWQHKT